VGPLGSYLAKRLPPCIAPPGELYNYSNRGMDLAGHLVEVASGVPFGRYVQDNILEPLDMRRTGFTLPLELAGDVAVGHAYRRGVHHPVRLPYLEEIPSMGLKATATDIAHLMIAHLEGGCYQGRRILKEETVRAMLRRQFTYDPRLPGTTYGYYEPHANGQRVLLQAGIMPGYVSLIALLPEHRLGFFITYNNTNTQQRLNDLLLKHFLDRYYPVGETAAREQPAYADPTRYQHLVGKYRKLTYSRCTFEKLASLPGQTAVTVAPEGRLLFGADQWVEVEPLLFRSGDQMALFRTDARGAVTRLYIGLDAYEKLPWYETDTFQLTLFGSLALVFLSACFLWPLGWAISLLFRRSPRRQPFPRLAGVLAFLVSLLNLVFLIGIASQVLQNDYFDFLFGAPPLMKVLLAIPLVTLGLTVIVTGYAVRAWRAGLGSLVARWYCSLTTLAALALLPFLYYWNLLGFQY
jgi:hypothetical protein